MVFMAKSGVFDGPRLKGSVLPQPGGNWSLVRADVPGVLDVRLSLGTGDGAIILMTYSGWMVASSEDFEYALDFQKPDDPGGADRYYFRTNPLFETGSEHYAWFNHIITVGTGRTGDGGVIYDIYKIL